MSIAIGGLLLRKVCQREETAEDDGERGRRGFTIMGPGSLEYANEIHRWCRWVCLGCKRIKPSPRRPTALDIAQRLTWTSQVQLYAVIAFAALALWFLFDRTALGMATSLILGIGSWLVFMLTMTPYLQGLCFCLQQWYLTACS